jgi:RNA polymerase sigma factor (TIGR02999 family)
MDDESIEEISQLLGAIHAGHTQSEGRLVALIYDRLRQQGARLMRHERPDHTLQPTALVHEALIRLLQKNVLATVENRRHLFGVVAQAMEEILCEHARRRNARKRGGSWNREPLDAVLAFFEQQDLDVLDLRDALDQLATFHPRQSQVVRLVFYGGCTQEEVAEQLDVSLSTVESDLRIAKAWLCGRLNSGR